MVLATATQEAIEKVTAGIQDKELPAVYLLGEKYVEAMRELAVSENAKLVLLPGDIPAAVRGLMSTTK